MQCQFCNIHELLNPNILWQKCSCVADFSGLTWIFYEACMLFYCRELTEKIKDWWKKTSAASCYFQSSWQAKKNISQAPLLFLNGKYDWIFSPNILPKKSKKKSLEHPAPGLTSNSLLWEQNKFQPLISNISYTPIFLISKSISTIKKSLTFIFTLKLWIFTTPTVFFSEKMAVYKYPCSLVALINTHASSSTDPQLVTASHPHCCLWAGTRSFLPSALEIQRHLTQGSSPNLHRYCSSPRDYIDNLSKHLKGHRLKLH